MTNINLLIRSKASTSLRAPDTCNKKVQMIDFKLLRPFYSKDFEFSLKISTSNNAEEMSVVTLQTLNTNVKR